MRTLTSLSLRMRLALFFALIGGGGAAAIILGSWAGFSRLPDQSPSGALVLAALVSIIGLWALTLWVAMRFDQHVAQPIDHLSSELRLRAEGINQGEIDVSPGQYLGALGPAMADTNRVLREMREGLNAEIAACTKELDHAVDVLADILSTLPTGVVACTSDHRISHLNGPALHLLADEGPVGLDRDVTTLIDPAALEEARNSLLEFGAPPSVTFKATTRGTHRTLYMRIALLNTGSKEGAYVLALPEASALETRAPIVHDVGLHSRATEGLAARSFVVFDSETTGLDPAGGDDLVQLSGVRIVNGRQVVGDVFDTFIDPGRRIPPASTKIHKITDDMVVGAPNAADAVAAFHAWCGDAVLVAHNAAFDMAFLHRSAPAAGCTFDHDVVDTVHLSALAFPHESDHRLDTLMERLGVSWDEGDRHTALGDSKMTAEVLLKLLTLLERDGITELAHIADAQGSFKDITRAQSAYVN
ncbi:MAG: exonuclease domain-containing protein [Pseudomonadota bacterium]